MKLDHIRVLRGERDLWRRAPKAEYSNTEAPITAPGIILKCILPPSRDFGAPECTFSNSNQLTLINSFSKRNYSLAGFVFLDETLGNNQYF